MKKIFSIILMTAIFMTSFSAVPVFAQDSYVMKVSANGRTTFYTDFGEGWVSTIELAEDCDVTLTLLCDWYAGDTNSNGFVDSGETAGLFKTYKNGVEFGTDNGRLCLNNEKIKLTVDLNGHSLSRNLEIPTLNGHVFYIAAGTLTIRDTSEVQTGKITGAYNEGEGGAFYVVNGSLYIESGEISGNECTERGAGIYWNSDDILCLTGGKITGNEAGWFAGGVLVRDIGEAYLGGTIFISGNIDNNGDEDNLAANSSTVEFNQAMGQKPGVPVAPFKEGAYIGVQAQEENDLMSDSDSMFNANSYKYFNADDSKYYIRAVYKTSGGNNTYQIYYTSRTNPDIKRPNIRSVSVKDSSLLKKANIDNENQVITLTAVNTKKNAFNFISLDSLITYTLSPDASYVDGDDDVCNLLSTREYKVMGIDNSYILCTVEIVPEGGEWAEEQDEIENNYVMTVNDGDRFRAYADFGSGWVDAVKKSRNQSTTITLLSDWIAPNGKFDYEKYTDDGRLYLNDLDMDLVIDLNGHTISRNLTSPTENGQVFYMNIDGSLTITDSSEAKTGKITGGNSTDNGGAFYVDYGELHLNGGTVTGNKANNGGAVYADDLDDACVYVNGGKISGNTAVGNGGAIYLENGYLYVDGGEITGNSAANGAGVYWNSRNAGCFTGGKITGNKASGEAGGIYCADYGEIYLGGTAVIVDNKNEKGVESNLYLCENNVDINHTRGQATGVPNKPLTDGANIGITSVETYDLISDSNSYFDQGSFGYLHADDDHTYYIRSVYDANKGNNSHQLWYTAWAHIDARYPRIKTVAVLNDSILHDAKLDYNTQTIILKSSMDASDSFKSVRLDKLISYTFDHEGEYILDADQPRDLRTPQEYKIMSDNGTYVTCLVKVDWYCAQHKDSDGNYICDYCEEYTLTDFAILGYNKETNEATVFAPKTSKYMLIFADYEGNKLENVDIVEHEFTEGVNTVQQENKTFVLENEDKVMLWYDMINLVPVCNTLTIK